jgi:hypothetical protein
MQSEQMHVQRSLVGARHSAAVIDDTRTSVNATDCPAAIKHMETLCSAADALLRRACTDCTGSTL